ncbi:integrase arm-type DNA-binding domain-containing protein [Salipiger sp. 1_MG-2023]|uniref:tyrosine-type recombinase/integrase n=1 Tax=Salipiger sp. 1_MG-2023 TaxID=3062665 RepID=UPI0026E18358|nr:integrase arm-type DNA-binding domain-containing protein [Salipiger sp. 1_MG-2023]MDO6584820.1 integrase arm-type DNA-binding domain-containing protein [Salipiger sp. 1_MG-2023]
MPKMVPEMGALDIKRLRHPGRGRNVTFAVGGVPGLLLQITPTGARSWILRTMIGKKRRDVGLGSYPGVSLSDARNLAREARDKVRRGIDPIEERKAVRAELITSQSRGLTFTDALDRYCDAKLVELATDRDRVRWRSMVERYAVPEIGGMLVGDLTTQDMLRVLEPVWVTKHETARKLRSRIEAILAWATVTGHRKGDNPAAWKHNLSALLPKPDKVAKAAHWPAVALSDAAPWFAELGQRQGIAARALEFLTLTASRSGAVRSAEWHEIDTARNLWIVPAAKMKTGQEHRVPLTAPALAIVGAMPRRADSSYIFAAPRGGTLSDMSLGKVMRDMQARAEKVAAQAGEDVNKAGWRDSRSGKPAVPHGLRSTFRDWAGDLTDWPSDMAELSLAHQVGSEVERAYRRGDMIEKRRQMMDDWAKFLGAA